MRPAPAFTARLAATLILSVALACNDGPLAPSSWGAYRLISINGRPLPTTYSSQLPTDSFYFNRMVEQYRFLSDTLLLHDAFIESTELLPDGSVTHRLWTCWHGSSYRYRQSGDSLLLTRLAPFAALATPSVLLLRSDHLLGITADSQGPIRLRFDHAEAMTTFCPRS